MASLMALLLALAALIQVRVTQLLVDRSLAGQLCALGGPAAALAALIALAALATWARGWSTARISSRTGARLKQSLGRALLAGDYRTMRSLAAGDALSAINTDVEVACAFLGGELVELFSQLALALAALCYLVSTQPLLALVTFAYTPIGLWTTLSLNRRMNALHPVRAGEAGRALGFVEQLLSQLPIVKSFLLERQTRDRAEAHYRKVCGLDLAIAKWNALMQPACSATAMVPRLLFLLYGGLLVLRRHLSVGELVAVYDLLGYIIGPTVYLPFLLNGLNRSLAALRRVQRLAELPQAQPTPQRPLRPGELPALRLEGVRFGHCPERPVLSSVNFVQSGPGLVAVRGGSGAGKTTLMDLIFGLYPPDGGRIEVRGEVAAMPQESYLFRGSLMDNVRAVRPEASEAQLSEALRRSGVAEFLDELPQGSDTLLGEGNAGLSGGQCQRVALARVLLSGRPIWLLDEPTSALDEATERIVLEALTTMARTKLIVVITHRPALLQAAGRVMSLEGGALHEVIA